MTDNFRDSRVKDFFDFIHVKYPEDINLTHQLDKPYATTVYAGNTYDLCGANFKQLRIQLHLSSMAQSFYHISYDLGILIALTELLTDKEYNSIWNQLYMRAFKDLEFLGSRLENSEMDTVLKNYIHTPLGKYELAIYDDVHAFGLTADDVRSFLDIYIFKSD